MLIIKYNVDYFRIVLNEEDDMIYDIKYVNIEELV